MTDSVEELVAAFADRLARAELAFGHGAGDARSEAELLVLGYLDRHPWDGTAPAALQALLERRISERIPSACLTGRAWFAERWFEVDPGVMIPRSPLQELILDRFHPWLRRTPERILDLCCGSGALGIATALAMPGAEVVLVDIDRNAIACAQRNIARFGLGGRVEARVSSLLQGVAGEAFDLVLANPPYVPSGELAELPPEYGHEPRHGLESGSDGLDSWRQIVASIGSHLHPDGLLAGEVGHLAPDLAEAFPALPFVWPELARTAPMRSGDFGVFLLDADCLSTHP